MFLVKLLIIVNGLLTHVVNADEDLPKFGEPMQNVTVSLGREAVFSCTVDNLQTYKIAWLRVDTQTILTIQNHIITKNHRMSITHAEKRHWVLRIKDVKESDKGWYMCQINTDPMKSQTGYLDVVVPPDILDFSTSTDMVVREGSNVTLKCAARGSPLPVITWRREGNEPIALLPNGEEAGHVNGSSLTIEKAGRMNMGAYLCIASNGIPPSVSKRIMLIIHFPPMISVQNQLVGASMGQTVTLDCHSEAYPKSINYWSFKNKIISPDDKYQPAIHQNEYEYRVMMRLTIKSVDMSDFGSYKCMAKNSLGDTDGVIKLYYIPQSTIVSIVTPTPTIIRATSSGRENSLDDKMLIYKPLPDNNVFPGNNKRVIGSTSDSMSSSPSSDGSWKNSGYEDNRHGSDGGGKHKGGGGEHGNSLETDILNYVTSGETSSVVVLFGKSHILQLFISQIAIIFLQLQRLLGCRFA